MDSNLLIKPDDQEWVQGKVPGFKGKNLLELINGGLKRVCIAPGADYPVHLHPDKTEFVYLLDGNVQCSVESDTYSVGKGDFFIFPAGLYHKITNNSNEEVMALVGNIKI